MKKLLHPLMAMAMLLTAVGAAAEAPQGYYRSLEGKKDGELKTAIYQLIHNFTQVSSYNDLPRYFQRTDVYPNSSRWWDMYSDIPLYAPSFKGLNREHSFPKSWWGGSTGVPAYVDLNHLYPAEAAANMAKSNYPLGEVSRTSETKFDNGVSAVGYPVTGQGGGCQWVFEPADEYKGDFARTYFYMATCYQNLTWKYTYMVSNTTYPTLTGWASRMLLKWHRDDPVSQKELDRNDMIYSIQNNRNPFIDRPELAEYLWGDKMGQEFKLSGTVEPIGDPNLITPTQGMSLDFGEVAIGSSTTSELFFRGENLRGSLDLVLTGANKAMFSLPSDMLSTSLVNSPDGTWLRITYKPTALGEHEARVIISAGGITGSRGVILRGRCLEVPQLSACTATEATDITADSYRANWTYPENETVDYWVVTRTKYAGANVSAEEILAEEPGIIIENFGSSDSETYSVQSVRLGYRSPMSNVIFVRHSGVTGVEADQPLLIYGFEGCMRFICSDIQTGALIYDPTGRLVMTVDEIHNNYDLYIAPGIYMVTTDQNHRPVKVAVR